MVCDGNETDLDIGIPAVMLPQDAGESLKRNMRHNDSGKISRWCLWHCTAMVIVFSFCNLVN